MAGTNMLHVLCIDNVIIFTVGVENCLHILQVEF
jgi:hypothetical protein